MAGRSQSGTGSGGAVEPDLSEPVPESGEWWSQVARTSVCADRL